MGTARMKEDNNTDEDGKKRYIVSMEKVKRARTRDSKVPTAYHNLIKIQH